MFNQRQIKRWLAAVAVVATAGFPSVAMAMPIDGGLVSVPVAQPASASHASQAPPELTDVSSGGYFTPSTVSAAAQRPSQAPPELTDVSSGGYFTPSTVSAAAQRPSQAPPELTDVSSGGYFTPSAVPTTAQPGSGFQWGDAGIGAGSMVLLMAAGAAASVSIRRHRVRRVVTG